MDKEIKRIEKYAKEHNVPIMEKMKLLNGMIDLLLGHNLKL